MIPKLKRFFYLCLMPEIIDPRLKRGLPIRNPSRLTKAERTELKMKKNTIKKGMQIKKTGRKLTKPTTDGKSQAMQQKAKEKTGNEEEQKLSQGNKEIELSKLVNNVNNVKEVIDEGAEKEKKTRNKGQANDINNRKGEIESVKIKTVPEKCNKIKNATQIKNKKKSPKPKVDKKRQTLNQKTKGKTENGKKPTHLPKKTGFEQPKLMKNAKEAGGGEAEKEKKIQSKRQINNQKGQIKEAGEAEKEKEKKRQSKRQTNNQKEQQKGNKITKQMQLRKIEKKPPKSKTNGEKQTLHKKIEGVGTWKKQTSNDTNDQKEKKKSVKIKEISKKRKGNAISTTAKKRKTD